MTDSTSSAESENEGRTVQAFAFVAEEAPIHRDLPSALKAPQVELQPPPVLEYVPRPPAIAYLPVQARVDRSKNSEELAMTPVETKFKDIDGVIKIGRFSRFGPYGLHPSDPGRPFSLATPFGVAICPTLAPYAAARCGLR
jgi:hypothetical protein